MPTSPPSPPPAPDPKQTIAAQSAANKEAIEAQAKFNRINEQTPLGSSTYSGTPGEPGYTRTTSFSPEQQKLYEQQTGVTGQLYDLSSGELDRLKPVLESGLDTSGLVEGPGKVDVGALPNMVGGSNDADIQAASKRAEDTSFNSFMSRFEPQIERSRQRTEQRLADRGIGFNQDQYKEVTGNNEQSIYDAIQGASAQAQQIGNTQGLQQSAFSNDARNQLMNQILAANQANQGARQAGLSEQAYLRNIPINDITALLHGAQPQQPQFGATPQISVPTTDAGGIINQGYGNQVNAYNAQMAQPSFMDSLFGLGGSLGSAWIMSDRRLKREIQKLHKWGRHQLYAFKYLWSPWVYVGVMADEVPAEATAEINGYRAVNYGALTCP